MTEINRLKKLLNEQLSLETQNKEVILKISRELDLIILEYMKQQGFSRKECRNKC